MVEIQRVNYEEMPRNAQEIRECARALNDELISAYDKVNAMRQDWFGNRYNLLAQSFNNLIPNFHSMLDFAVTKLPDNIETIANNYSLADKGQVATPVRSEARKNIPEISPNTETDLRFMETAVDGKRDEISKNFTNARQQMNQIATAYSKIVWTSKAADTFLDEFTKIKNQIETMIDDINKEFVQRMQETKEDHRRAEEGNTIK